MSSRVAIAATGREVQVAQAAYPRFAWKLSYGKQSWLRERTQNITPWQPLNAYTELETISGLYLACQGPYGEFYYSDPDDNSRKGQYIGTGNGPYAPMTYQVPVGWGTGPFSPSLSFPVGGLNVVSNVYATGYVGSWTIGADNTSLVFGGVIPPQGIITADFTFYYRCRFLDDKLSFSEWATNLWELAEVNFESVKY
jgi:hypothetical protein